MAIVQLHAVRPTAAPSERRHWADYRDEIEHAEVARILSELPAEHPARVA
jgi:hypothetical protein